MPCPAPAYKIGRWSVTTVRSNGRVMKFTKRQSNSIDFFIENPKSTNMDNLVKTMIADIQAIVRVYQPIESELIPEQRKQLERLKRCCAILKGCRSKLKRFKRKSFSDGL